ncbi:hypothetical protein [Lysobacter gummosus]
MAWDVVFIRGAGPCRNARMDWAENNGAGRVSMPGSCPILRSLR